jgi:hypothetical protein
MSSVMEWGGRFATQWTQGPLQRADQIFAFDPKIWVHAYVIFAFFFLVNDLVRTAMMAELVRSVTAHFLVCLLTLFPGIVLGFALLWAGYRHPERVWFNLAIAVALYPWWVAGGALTKLARRDSEGADTGWIFHGAMITFPLGLLAVAIFR